MWLILATTEVQFITSGIGLRVASACLWQKLYHFTSHKVADAFGHENTFFLLEVTQFHPIETACMFGKLEWHLMR